MNGTTSSNFVIVKKFSFYEVLQNFAKRFKTKFPEISSEFVSRKFAKLEKFFV
jgi:hypothetical protein